MKNVIRYEAMAFFNSSRNSLENQKTYGRRKNQFENDNLLYNEVCEEYEELREKDRDRYCFFILHSFFTYFIAIYGIIVDININGCE